jgi:hypothetical protein
MKNKFGSSLYYASDKNIFDAINNAKVDGETIQEMFRRRNIVCSRLTKREDLAEFFSRLTHDYLDHQDLSIRLGTTPRRERVTSVDLIGVPPKNAELQAAIETLKVKLRKHGDVVVVTQEGSVFHLEVRYTEIDYKRTEFSQLQKRTGVIEIAREGQRTVVRSTKSNYMDEARDELVAQIRSETPGDLDRREISLAHFPSPSVRSQFFLDLMTKLPGYVRKDVTDVFVFKPRPEASGEDEHDGQQEDSAEPHVERVLLKGVGVSQSDILRQLTKEKDYFIAKVGWIVNKTMGSGGSYEVEATFTDPRECTGFSYLLRGVHDLTADGKTAKKRRPPVKEEINEVAKVVEEKARELLDALNSGASGDE